MVNSGNNKCNVSTARVKTRICTLSLIWQRLSVKTVVGFNLQSTEQRKWAQTNWEHIWHNWEIKKKKKEDWFRPLTYCSGTISITSFSRRKKKIKNVHVVLNTVNYNLLSTIPNMYIIYRHQRNNRPFGSFGEKVGGGPWHTVIGTGALKLARKQILKIIESINHADGECFPQSSFMYFFSSWQ